MKLYGIANCDGVRRARAWLAAQGVANDWHDFKKHGVPEADLDRWIEAVGWQTLVNRHSSTWRKLPDAERAAVGDAAAARALMLAQPSVIKRPLVRWGDGSVTVGFDSALWAQRIAKR